jgi:hypothetical protein
MDLIYKPGKDYPYVRANIVDDIHLHIPCRIHGSHRHGSCRDGTSNRVEHRSSHCDAVPEGGYYVVVDDDTIRG